MEYQLVPMDRSHLSGVAELERLCFSTPWNETMLEEELFNPTASFIVAHLAFLTLEVRPSNQAAVALYCKHGFQEAGRRKDYYQDPTEDALLLTRTFVR